MKRCTRCIMPESIPGITFDEDGICNFCHDYKSFKCLGEDALKTVLSSHKKKNSKYDCIVALSGGRDSTFVLYYAKKILGLNVLAVNYDNEFRIDQALINMQTACKILDVDFISVRSKRNIAHKIVLNSIRCSLPDGLHGISKFLCTACTYGYRSVVYRAAVEHGAPLILWGETEGEATQSMEAKAMQGLGQSISRRLLDINTYKARYHKILQRVEFSVPGNNPILLGPVVFNNPDVTEIRLFDYIRWDRRKLKQTIIDELGWEKPKGHISSWRTDCRLHLLVNYCYVTLLSCTKECFGYCKMINNHQISRSEALVREEETLGIDEGDVRELLEKEIGLSKKNAAEIMQFR